MYKIKICITDACLYAIFKGEENIFQGSYNEVATKIATLGLDKKTIGDLTAQLLNPPYKF